MGRKEKFVAFRDEEEIINRIDAVVADKEIDRATSLEKPYENV